MKGFYLTPEGLVFLCQIVLAVGITTYLFTVKKKSAATRWLAASMVGHCIFLSSAFLIATAPAEWAPILTSIDLSAFVGALAATIAFAYTFLGNVYPKEFRWVAAAAGVATILFAGHALLVALGFDSQRPWLLIILIFSLGAVAFQAHVRKAVRLSPHASRGFLWRTKAFLKAKGRSARAHRAFSLLSVLILLLALSVGLSAAGLISNETNNTILLAVFLLYAFGVVTVYVNHAPEPTTFQVKVIGLALATVMAVLGFTVIVLYEEADLARASDVPLPNASLRFEPIPDGGYRIVEGGLDFESDLGSPIEMENGGYPAVGIGFEFPFAGQRWDLLHVDDDGFVSFGGGFGPLAEFSTTELPMIAPYFASFQYDEGGEVFVRRDSANFVVTWQNAPNPLAWDSATVQLALNRDGAVAFHYGFMPVSVVNAERGLYPSGSTGEVSRVSPEDPMPAALPAGSGFAQDYRMEYRQFVHGRARRMLWLIFGSTIFILIVFPFLLSSSITKPLRQLLDGVRRVNEGDLETKVPVTVRDELGFLAHNFNVMTQSLRQAEEQLRAYAQELETRVEERTAELQRSLEELQATQTQLVQQEKLASLGALTAGIAHEIKNPLNFVNNFAALSVELADELAAEIASLESRLGADDADELNAIIDDLKINAEKITEHGKRADGIVKSMLLHSRGKSGERQKTDLNSLLNEYVNLAFHGMRAQDPHFNCDIEREYDASVGAVDMVPQDIGRVFINLLNNAFYAVGEKAKLMNGSYEPRVRVSTRRIKEHVEVVVKDNGPGIPETLKKKIFEPFFTTKPTGSGTGLGLSLSHEIVTREHGGTMHVESEDGEATTFRILLPIRYKKNKPLTPQTL